MANNESGVQFIEEQTELLQRQLVGRNIPWFTDDGDIEKFKDIYPTFKRDDVLKKLHEIQRKDEYTAAEWVAFKFQANWLSSWDRDLRRRYRSRVTAFKIDYLQKTTAAQIASQVVVDVGRIASQIS